MKNTQRHYGDHCLARTVLTLLICASTCGCAGLLIGSAATSAVVAHDERTTGTFIEDQAIELKAMEAIRSHLELKEQSHISVTSYNQVALVTGQTPTNDLREAAILIVSKVSKVRHVYDELEIATPNSLLKRSGDSLLTAKVKTKLFTMKNVDATKVKVVSENDVVFLMGILTHNDANVAAQAASRVSGVRKIVKLFEYKD